MTALLPVVAYLMLALLARRCAGRLPYGPQAVQWARAAWMFAGLALLAALQAAQLVVPLLRALAQAQGWYAWRRAVQAPLLVAAAAALVLLWLHRTPADHVLAAALLVLGTLALLRFVSLHHTDAWLAARWLGWPAGRWAEAAGLGIGLFQGLRVHAQPIPS